ncbi:MAG: hypothetical protein IKQ85_05520, partial [Bacteroidaceae bacterium]|nr:hypothetical protein [Bacteroidaceae bacterium]
THKAQKRGKVSIFFIRKALSSDFFLACCKKKSEKAEKRKADASAESSPFSNSRLPLACSKSQQRGTPLPTALTWCFRVKANGLGPKGREETFGGRQHLLRLPKAETTEANAT